MSAHTIFNKLQVDEDKKIQDERIHSRYKIIRSCLFDPGDGRVPERLAPQKVKTDVKDYREFEN